MLEVLLAKLGRGGIGLHFAGCVRVYMRLPSPHRSKYSSYALDNLLASVNIPIWYDTHALTLKMCTYENENCA